MKWDNTTLGKHVHAMEDGHAFPNQDQFLHFLKKLKEVFDVCDEDADGYIRVERFVDLGLRFGQGDEVRLIRVDILIWYSSLISSFSLQFVLGGFIYIMRVCVLISESYFPNYEPLMQTDAFVSFHNIISKR